MERLTPDSADSSYTRPSTVFTGIDSTVELRAADAAAIEPQPAHWPLVVMLLLTQTATGLLLAAALLPGHPPALRLAGAITLTLGVIASTTHLGQPLKAWRAFLGWRKSWLSREILAFGAAAPAAGLAMIAPGLAGLLTTHLPSLASAFPGITAFPASPAFLTASCAIAVLTATASVFCSIMVYADTRRALWKFPITTFSMAGCTLTVAATAAAWLTGRPVFCGAAMLLLMVRTLAVSRFTHCWREEDPQSHPHAKSALLMYGRLNPWWHGRLFAALAGAALIWHFPAMAFALVLLSEFAERLLFFQAVVALKMPGIPQARPRH